MAQVAVYKELGVELGNIAALNEMINNYLAKDKQSKARVARQSDRELTKVLKTHYQLNDGELAQIISIVEGKKIDRKSGRVSKPTNIDYSALKREIDSMIESIGITIRDQSLSEENYLKKVKANLSVRKGKIVKQLHAGREKKAN